MQEHALLFATYWQALDSNDQATATQASAEILTALDDILHAMARKCARQLHSPLAETEDLKAEMQLKILSVLRTMPRTVVEPARYLITTAQNVLYAEMRKVINASQEARLDTPRCGPNESIYTLLDVLAAPNLESDRESSAQLSPVLAEVLETLRPCEQLAIQAEYQFANWTPRSSARTSAGNRANYYYGISRLRKRYGTTRRPAPRREVQHAV